MSSRRSWITFYDEDAEKEAVEEAKDAFFHTGHRTQALFDHDFKFYWMVHYICLCLLGAILIHVIDEVYFIDAVFHAVSAMTGAGLSTLPMYRFSKPAFCIFAFLMYFGSPSFMLLPTILYRRHCFARLNQQIYDHLQKKKSSLSFKDLTATERQVIQEYKQLDHALSVLAYIILLYNVLVITIGVLILNVTLRIKDLQIELQQRNFSYLDNAVYLTISAFANAGCSITSDSLMSMADNPCAYLLLSCLILAGNTALPICLRCLIAGILRFENILIFLFYPRYDPKKPDVHVESTRVKYRRSLQYILNNPRRLTTHLFSNLQTKVLAFMVSFLILIQYIFFLGATMNRDSARIEHSKSALAGIGYFQTISVRSAGFTIMDLRLLNQGLLVVYCVMMYISSFPFVSVLESSVHKEDDRKQQQQIAAMEKVTLVDELQPSSESDNRVHALEASQHSYEGSQGSGDSSHSESTDYGDGDHVNVVAIQKKFVVTYFYRHSFFLLSAVLILAFSEDRMLYDRTMNVNLWYIFFEVISAYGDVGLSLGIEGKVYSLSGAMTAIGKCVIIFIMLLGKHRGLPNKKDDVIDFQFNRYRVAWRYHHHHHHNHHHHEVEEGPAAGPQSQLLEDGMNAKSKRSHSVKVKQHKSSSERSYVSYFFSSKRDHPHDHSSTRSIFPWSNKANTNTSSDKVSYNPLVVKSVE